MVVEGRNSYNYFPEVKRLKHSSVSHFVFNTNLHIHLLIPLATYISA